MRSTERTALVSKSPRSLACQGKRNAQQGGIDGSCSLENLDVDRQIDQGGECANGADVACFGSFDAQILGLTVDTAGRRCAGCR